MTVWIYDQGEELKVFATEDAARAWKCRARVAAD
jgi:hypothetical protein